MKGTKWNGDHFANKGMSSSKYSYMFSVGGLVAFECFDYSSPDGRQYSHGTIPAHDEYKLEEEIILEEYDRTESDEYGSGNYNTREIVELKDEFWVEYSTQTTYKCFLVQVLETPENVFTGEFIKAQIAEVRNHPGKFLHIYEVPDGYEKCKKEDFATTVATMNLQKKEENDYDEALCAANFRGIEMIFGITFRGWYASQASWGKHSVQLAHEHDSTSRDHYRIMIMPCVPDGYYRFYMGGTPMSLSIEKGGRPYINTLTTTHWANSQNWHYVQIAKLEIQPGWIFINGEDVYNDTASRIKEDEAKRISARNKRFAEFSQAVLERHGEHVLRLALKKRGAVLSILGMLKDLEPVDKEIIKKAMSASDEAMVIANLIGLYQAKTSPVKAALVGSKAYAWNYLYNALPSVKFAGNFDDAKAAIALYGKQSQPSSGITLGEIIKAKGICL